MGQDSRQTRSPDRRWRAHRDRLLAPLLLPVVLVGLLGVIFWFSEEPRPIGSDCSPLPTAALPFDPADERQLAAFATDIFVGQILGGATGPIPSSPVPGAPTWLKPVQREVAVLKTEKGAARGTVIVHQAFQFGIEGCHGAVAGDTRWIR